MSDPVNNPAHYTAGGIECIEAIKASMTPKEWKGLLKGNAMKYLWRYKLKGNPLQDLCKARYYLDRLIEYIEREDRKGDQEDVAVADETRGTTLWISDALGIVHTCGRCGASRLGVSDYCPNCGAKMKGRRL